MNPKISVWNTGAEGNGSVDPMGHVRQMLGGLVSRVL